MNCKTMFLPALLLPLSGLALAGEAYYAGNPGSAYPPSCVSAPLANLDLAADNAVKFYGDRIWLETVHKIQSDDPFDNLGKVQLDMYRVGCSEPGRSVIIAEISFPPEWADLRERQLVLPWLGGNTGFDPYPLDFKPEPNGWGKYTPPLQFLKRSIGDYTGGWYDASEFRWRYVLDIPPMADRDAASAYYNNAFSILLYRGDGEHFLTIDVPATDTLFFPAPVLPLGGRLSGTWVEEGSADQGILISFSALPLPPGGSDQPEQSELLVFFSWYTFDAQGDMLWLTGTASLSQGSSDVLIPIVQVDHGTFLGDSPAQRSTVGSARLRAVHCDLLELEYTLDDLGLGHDTMQLHRLFALETADYPCRDYAGLRASIHSPETDS